MTFSMSKSKYCRGVQCPKMLWMDIHMPEQAEATAPEAVLRTGTEVGELARDYFGGHVLVEFSPDKKQMCQDTRRFMNAGEPVIAEASFLYKNNFCSVDILRRTETEIQLIEVKSSTEVHEIYLYDMAYQYYVLTHCGISVTKIYNMHIDSSYERRGELELDKLFRLEDCTDQILDMQRGIEENLAVIQTYLDSVPEPDRDLDLYCEKPYECEYKRYCRRHVEEPSVFSIHRLSAKKKYQLYRQGVVTFGDVIEAKPALNDRQWRQVKASYYEEPPKIDRKALGKFLDGLTYPLYYLDFETYQQAVPGFDGVKPYMQIPFQYSLHIQREMGAEPEHCEFLAKEGTDPRRALAEQLCRQIPGDVCSLAYNMSFEKTVIRNLADLYPDLSDHLMNIHSRMQDLMVPFQRQYYYCRELQGSYSIKKVLPALCGGDPELDYHGLEDIHNGSEAMEAFADLPGRSGDEIRRIRKNLLAYCRLDTLAMVKILARLYEMTR